MTRPLLTFVVAGFQHHRFVREAVEAAFAQTYSPLEIILSDDCSPDGTFDVMRLMAFNYTGPHAVVLNRNPVRRSLGGHLNQLVSLSRGELIVISAADDISEPERTTTIYETWEREGRRATSIHSAYVQIDEHGMEIPSVFSQSDGCDGRVMPTALDFIRTLQPTMFGCTHAFSKRLFEIFGNVPEDLIHEDDVLALRSLIAGSITYIDKPLVRYRVHGANIYAAQIGRDPRYNFQQLARQEYRYRNAIRYRKVMYDAFLHDIATAGRLSLLSDEEYQTATTEAAQRSHYCQSMTDFLEAPFLKRVRRVFKVRRQQLATGDFHRLLIRLLPVWALLSTRLALNYAERIRGKVQALLRLVTASKTQKLSLRKQATQAGESRGALRRLARSK